MYADHVRFDPSHPYMHKASTDALISWLNAESDIYERSKTSTEHRDAIFTEPESCS